MPAIDDTIQAINSAKEQYVQAADGLAVAVQEAETTSNLLAEVGAEAMVEVVSEVKTSLEGVAAATDGLTSSLDDAIKVLESAKG
ncbi:hypothetical protein Kisp01_27760 [Kineosporia sp. NBRC 101677]|uniref:hypothetical protein n=1 Tax=Kineosporia sp. NBRC 101677 TaxID=3032197 RepID=UPI0024A39540|nr:hypothetical protein [Kineosporia sp. NBRC 101677]GLY15761.1 hypothetical protein Kisp01_27760 [Kineosporia sp. NBRC 101677]